MRIKRFFLFAGAAIAGAALFASCGEKEQIGGEDDPKNPDSEVVLKDGQVVEHTFVRKAAARIELDMSKDETELFQKSDSFAIKMFNAVCENNGDENFCFSPLSVQVVLYMLCNGVDNSNYVEMSQALFGEYVSLDEVNNSFGRLKNALDSTNCVKLSNGMWLQTGTNVSDEYIDVVRNSYYSEFGFLDFNSDPQSALDSISQWAYDNTYGKLKKMDLESFELKKPMVQANTAWFASSWLQAFDQNATYTGQFTTSSGQTQNVSMMKLIGGYGCVYDDPDSSYLMVSLPFEHQSFWMDIIVPGDGVSLDSIMTYVDWSANLRNQPTEKINLDMPRFSIDSDLKMRSVLESLGVSAPFRSLPRIAPLIQADYLNQKVKIDVTESGVEAAAITVGTFSMSLPRIITIDGPFAFAIRDDISRTHLFMGRVNSID